MSGRKVSARQTLLVARDRLCSVHARLASLLQDMPAWGTDAFAHTLATGVRKGISQLIFQLDDLEEHFKTLADRKGGGSE